MALASVLDTHYKDKAFTAETVEKWLKEAAAHDMAKTAEETGDWQFQINLGRKLKFQENMKPDLVTMCWSNGWKAHCDRLKIGCWGFARIHYSKLSNSLEKKHCSAETPPRTFWRLLKRPYRA